MNHNPHHLDHLSPTDCAPAVQPPQPSAPRVLRGLAEVADAYEVILCDVWGVLHDGDAHFGKAVDALMRFRAKGGAVALITNSPNPGRFVRAQLDRLGVPRKAYDAIVSSGDVALSLLLARAGEAVLHLGPPDENALFDEVFAVTGEKQRHAPLDEADFVLCTGLLDPCREQPSDYDAMLARMRARGLDFICANPDIVVEVGGLMSFCAGAIAERYAALGGAVIHSGKPFGPIYERALSLVGVSAEADRSRVLAIGDAMDTDIKGARGQNLASLLVTSGIHRGQLHAGGGLEPTAAALRQLAADAGFAPDLAIPELAWQT